MRHISTGDLFRAAIKNSTPLGKEAKSYLDAGKLVPDSITVGMVQEVLGDLKGKPVSFILDGFPRNLEQADKLDTMLAQNEMKLDRAIFMEVAENELVERLSGRRVCRSCGATYHVKNKPPKNGNTCDVCGSQDIYQREDDKAEAIRTRLSVYNSSTKPLKEYYEKAKKLKLVNGSGSEQEVFNRIEKAMG
jgi:adenylate kinase